jgi:hypothetical protein
MQFVLFLAGSAFILLNDAGVVIFYSFVHEITKNLKKRIHNKNFFHCCDQI